MWFSSWLGKRQRSAPSGRSHASPHKRSSYRPRLEALEDRWLPSQVSLTVSSLADSGPGTLRAAILTADGGSHSDQFTIGFAVNGKVDLQSPLPDLNNSIAIQGPGASSLTIEPAAGVSLSSAIVAVDAGQTASLSGLTVANGNAGGIHSVGTLTVANCAVVNNSVASNDGNVFFGEGGGIDNLYGTLTVSDSTISGNTANGVLGTGGGIYSNGSTTISGSTVCGNSATRDGGGMEVIGPMTMSGCTLWGNSALVGGGIETVGSPDTTISGCTLSGNSANVGGGIYETVLLTISGCTLSGNSAGSKGGGIFNAASGALAVKDSTVLNNVAPLAADIYNLGAMTLDDSTVGAIGP